MTKVKLYILLFCLLIIGDLATGQQYPDSTYVTPYSFDGHFDNDPESSPFRFNILQNLSIRTDIPESYTIDQIAETWTSHKSYVPSELYLITDQVYWVKTTIKGNDTLTKHLFQVATYYGNDIVSFSEINAFYKDVRGEWVHHHLGTNVPMNNRPIQFWNNLIPVDVSSGNTTDLYVKLIMEGKDTRFLPNTIGINHIDESSIWPKQIYLSIKHGVFYAILLFQFFYLIILYAMEKERIHFDLALIVLGTLIGIAFTMDNFREFVIFPSWRTYHDAFSFVGIYLIVVGTIRFARSYFSYPSDSKLVKKVIPVFLIIAFFGIVINYFTRDIEDTNPYTLFAIIAASLISAYISIKSRNVSSHLKLIFSIAFIPPLIVLALMLLFSIGIDILNLQNFNLLFDYIKVAFLITLSALAISTGYRSKKIKDEKQEELKRNLSAEQRINKAITKFVPNEFISALGKKDITEVSLGDNTERVVTVLFSDIRGYTSLSERLTPEQNFQFVNNYSNQMGPIIRAHNGFINQYLGDGIMALFTHSAEDALNAAVAMHKANNTQNLQRVTNGEKEISVGIGMHTGPLIMGIMGDQDRYDAATISDTVNAAARLEGLTKHFKSNTLLSTDSLNLMINKPKDIRYLGPVKVKGKEKATHVYESFGGDKEDTKLAKRKNLKLFDEAVNFYFDQNFGKAVELFEMIVQNCTEDLTATMFLSKSKSYLTHGAPSDWNGIESLDFK